MQVEKLVLDGGARDAPAALPGQGHGRAVLLRGESLDLMGLVKDYPVPGDAEKRREIRRRGRKPGGGSSRSSTNPAATATGLVGAARACQDSRLQVGGQALVNGGHRSVGGEHNVLRGEEEDAVVAL